MLYSAEELRNIFESELGSIDYPEKPALLYNPIKYALSQGGKRLRPVLLLLTNQMFGGTIEKAMPAALAIEIFHNFTLVHDDIMDAAPLRRNVPTVYKKWNQNVGILSGDTMFALSSRLLAKIDPQQLPEIIELFFTTAIEVCEGQQYDMDFESQDEVSLPSYMEMIRLKTAVLLATSLKTGAILANAPLTESKKLYQFGIHIGLAFQIMDDLLDVFSDQELFGKQTGNDIVTNKKTWLYLKAYEIADTETKDKLNQAFGLSNQYSAVKIKTVTELYNLLHIKELAHQEISKHYQEAEKVFECIDLPSKIKEPLKRVTLAMAKRTF
jgi:geranylgeranyl diphosphate synthase type II